MRASHLTLAAVLLCPGLALAQAAAPSPAPAPVPAPAAAAEDPLVARVDGKEVRMSDVMTTAAEVLPPEIRNLPPALLMQRLPPEVIRQLTDRTITEQALVNAARAAGLDRDEEVRRRMRRAEDQELVQSLLSREVGPKVSDAALHARYEQEIARRSGEEEVHARHILLPTEEAAREALAELKGGADFAEVAKRRSTDPGSRDGGDLGFFKKGDMVPEFAAAAFALQPGQVSSEPVRTQFGWHIIKVEGRRAAPVPSFEESKQQLQRQMMQEQVDAAVRRIRSSAKVERLDTPPVPTPGGALLENATPPAPNAAPAPTPSGRGAAPQPQRR